MRAKSAPRNGKATGGRRRRRPAFPLRRKSPSVPIRAWIPTCAPAHTIILPIGTRSEATYSAKAASRRPCFRKNPITRRRQSSWRASLAPIGMKKKQARFAARSPSVNPARSIAVAKSPAFPRSLRSPSHNNPSKGGLRGSGFPPGLCPARKTAARYAPLGVHFDRPRGRFALVLSAVAAGGVVADPAEVLPGYGRALFRPTLKAAGVSDKNSFPGTHPSKVGWGHFDQSNHSSRNPRIASMSRAGSSYCGRWPIPSRV